MIPEASLKFFESFLKSSGPSGFEEPSAALYREFLGPFADEVRTDVMGNVTGVLNPDAEFKVMLDAHYDEIGFQIVNITPEGLLTFRAVGGIDKCTIPGIEVDILTEHGPVPGVIGRKPIHLQTQKERDTVTELHEMWIDIGAENKEDAEKMVSVADPVAFRANVRIMGNRIMSKGLDDKIGAFAIAEAFRILSTKKIKIGVYCHGAVQEELGLRGAHAGTFGIAPDAAIAVDVGFATDVPGLNKNQWGDVTLGGGPIVERNADVNPVLFRLMKQAAAKQKIPYQLCCGHRATGGTDTAAIQLSRGGVATALISIPNRYMHTPVEVCDLRDVENTAKLIAATVASLKPGDTFFPGID